MKRQAAVAAIMALFFLLLPVRPGKPDPPPREAERERPGPSAKEPGRGAEAFYKSGDKFCQAGDYEKAVEAYKESIRLKPKFYLAHFGLGAAYVGLGNRGAALEQYQILKPLDPNTAEVQFNLIYR